MRYARTSWSFGERERVRVRMAAGRKDRWSEMVGGDGEGEGWTVPLR